LYPHERSLVEEMANRPFALIGVNSDDVERAKKAIEENGLNWRSFQNQEENRANAISADWYVQGWPTIVVLDAEMKIRYRGHDGHEATEVAERLVSEIEAKQKQ